MENGSEEGQTGRKGLRICSTAVAREAVAWPGVVAGAGEKNMGSGEI